MSRTVMALAAALAFLPSVVLAHTGAGSPEGFVHGFAHPIGGLDHVLAMVAAGLFAAHLGGRALWLVPLAFISMMAVGGILGAAEVKMPFVEAGIALSIVVFGAVLAFRQRLSAVAAMALAGFFAIFHGHAHGTELPEAMSGLAYGIGFILVTALLHALGIGLGRVMSAIGQHQSTRMTQVAGGAVTITGLAILGGVL
ncbi:HupE/UreJ family protein [Microvirga sp. ACRRW]|uniref:HupE/UreJ family protein n=1 Tax=Microvirga sp. ACRRW TaxID=2918205 RepID=UPI001EF3D670|nr:HupE/UreJ family protein [Microvirga sp. ACRRW]MCG7393834.1 HupE/UreJ family protein [Microvirga sp. ACRRW]